MKVNNESKNLFIFHWIKSAAIAFAISVCTGLLSGYITVQVLAAQMSDMRQTVNDLQAQQQQQFMYLNQRVDNLQKTIVDNKN